MKIKFFSFVFLQVFLFFKIEYFSIFAITVIALNKIFNKKYFLDYNTLFFKLTTSIFYLIKLISATNINFLNIWKSTSFRLFSIDNPFIDMQQFLFKIKCNSISKNYIYDPPYRTETSWFPPIECSSYTLAYGPIENFIGYNIQNIWLSSLIVAFIFTALLLKIYFELLNNSRDDYKYIICFLFLSPAVNFLIDRANLDLIIYVSIYYILKNYQNFILLKIFVLLFFSLLKLHPVFIILGLFIYFVTTKEFKKASLHLFGLLIFSIFFANWYFNNSFFTPLPAYQGVTFGILSDTILLNRIIDFNKVFIYIFICTCLLLSILLNYKKLDGIKKMSYSTFSILFWFSCISVYANNDYRLVLLLLVFPYIHSTKNRVYELSYYLLLLLNPLPLIFNISSETQILNAGVYIDINFYFFLTFTLVLLLKQIIILYKN